MTTDAKTTILGAIMAVGVAVATYLQAGMDWHNPIWWCGMVTAMAAGLKGFYTKGI